jgi:hypothetical protein
MTKAEIPIDKIMADLKSGFGDIVIMEKYQISPAVLMKIKQGVRDFSTEPSHEGILVRAKADDTHKRVIPRNHAYYRIQTRDLDNAENVGVINDITKRGLQLQGIAAKAGEKKTLLVLADSYRVHSPFVFEAVCRWAAVDTEGESIAGFSITNISGPDLQELRKLIAELTAEETAQ